MLPIDTLQGWNAIVPNKNWPDNGIVLRVDHGEGGVAGRRA